MKNKRQYALNKLFNSLVIVGLLLIWAGADSFLKGETSWALGIGAAGLLFIIVPAIFTPYCYAFDKDGVSIRYVFFPTERYLWKNIRAIEVEDAIDSSRTIILDLFYRNVFSIKGINVGERRFYMNGNIRKSFRTKYLLEKYWDGTITGYLFEGVKKWLQKRRAKNEAQTEAHLTNEIVPMERDVRAKSGEWLKPFIKQAKEHGLEIKARYVYVTEDLEELNSRPSEGYTYTLIMDIARFGETDEDRIVPYSVDLLYVRLGKRSYRGVPNKYAEEELSLMVPDTLQEIYENGIDSYCNEN